MNTVLDDLKHAAARKWQGSAETQQAGLFARAADEIERLTSLLDRQQAAYERELEIEREAHKVALKYDVAEERERCAKLCDDLSEFYQKHEGLKYPELKTDAQTGADECAYAIRCV